MSQLFIGGLLSTPEPTTPIIGIANYRLSPIAVIMVGPNYNGMNSPVLVNSKDTNQD